MSRPALTSSTSTRARTGGSTRACPWSRPVPTSKQATFVNGTAALGALAKGGYTFTGSFFVPSTPVVEPVTFRLERGAFHVTQAKIDSLFIADRPTQELPAGFTVKFDHPPAVRAANQVVTPTTRTFASAAELANYFAPTLHFDASERYTVPVDADTETRPNVSRAPYFNLTPSGSINQQLDLQDYRTGGYTQSNTASAIYATAQTNGREWAISYFFHYPRRNWGDHATLGNTHEGDWEGATLFLGLGADGSSWTPKHFALSQHALASLPGDGGEIADWASLVRSAPTAHLFVSLGGHSTLAEPGEESYNFIPEQFYGQGEVYAGRNDVQLLPRRGDPAAPAWLRFPGPWGRVLSGLGSSNDGPRGRRSWSPASPQAPAGSTRGRGRPTSDRGSSRRSSFPRASTPRWLSTAPTA